MSAASLLVLAALWCAVILCLVGALTQDHREEER